MRPDDSGIASKPANILVTVKGSAKLLDFGLAKLTTEADSDATRTIEGTVLGTAAYMSPEQAEGKPLDERSDVFSFGAVLYEMLSGNRAFRGNSTATVMSAVLRDDPVPLQAPAELQRIVGKCLAKKPGNRFLNMKELRTALEQISTRPADQSPSIAVLPFANMSADKEQEYFSDGLADEIINALVQVEGLKVTARTSAFSFKGKDLKIAQIAQELGVEHILEGSVRKAGNRVRITAQLIKATDGFHLWSERYDRELSDIFAVQDEISAAIAKTLRAKLSAKPESPAKYTPSVAAYEAYLKGRYNLWRRTPEVRKQCRECYEEAIQLDPKFALPYVGLTEWYHIAASTTMDPHEAIALGREYARKALELDPGLPEANAWLGNYAVVYDYDWQEAARRYEIALQRQPISPHIRHYYGYFYLRHVGKAAEAVEQHRLCLEADPFNLIARVGLVISLRDAGRDQEASQEARRTVELEPDFFAAYTLGVWDLTWEPLAEALALAEKGYALFSSSHAPTVAMLAGLLVKAGNHTRAAEVISELGGGERREGRCALAIYHLLCGDIEQAAEWMETAIQRHEQMVTMLLLGRPWGPMLGRSERWPKLSKMMNLPENLS
jgi:serine/threonine-protein kinase